MISPFSTQTRSAEGSEDDGLGESLHLLHHSAGTGQTGQWQPLYLGRFCLTPCFLPSCKNNTLYILLNISVSLARWLRHSTVESGHLRELGHLLRLFSVHPPLFIPTDADLVPFLFLGGSHSSSEPQSRCWGQNVPPGESAGESGALLSVSFWVITKWREAGGRCSWNITAAVNLLLSYCYCQLRSYYSLIKSSPRRWWVEINLSIIVKGLWQSEPHSWKTPSYTNSACYIYVQPIFDLGGHILRNARGWGGGDRFRKSRPPLTFPEEQTWDEFRRLLCCLFFLNSIWMSRVSSGPLSAPLPLQTSAQSWSAQFMLAQMLRMDAFISLSTSAYRQYSTECERLCCLTPGMALVLSRAMILIAHIHHVGCKAHAWNIALPSICTHR